MGNKLKQGTRQLSKGKSILPGLPQDYQMISPVRRHNWKEKAI